MSARCTTSKSCAQGLLLGKTTERQSGRTGTNRSAATEGPADKAAPLELRQWQQQQTAAEGRTSGKSLGDELVPRRSSRGLGMVVLRGVEQEAGTACPTGAQGGADVDTCKAQKRHYSKD